MKAKFRPNVAGIFQRPADEKIFIAERSDRSGAWQFPQGGVDKGESPEEAFAREMLEEINLRPKDYEHVESRGGYRYRFPDEKLRWGKFCGQEQTYFLCRFTGKESVIRLDGKHGDEFSDYCWIDPMEFDLGWLPKFKREVYRSVLEDFFDVRV